jgi:protoporphyrinogen oxidase
MTPGHDEARQKTDSETGDGHRQWAVVGGGVLGLTFALRLAQNGHQVTVIERAETIGGLASAWGLGEIVWDRHYHVILQSDSRLLGLIDELGLGEAMRWAETQTGFYTDGRFHSMSNTVEFLRFPPLNILSKLRLGATIFYASRINNWRRLEKTPVADWLTRWSGSATFEKIWLPLLRSKLGESYKKTSAAFIWATIARMYAARRSGYKKEMFGYVNGGYARVFDAFKERLEASGVTIRIRTEVASVSVDGNSRCVLIETADGEVLKFDRAVLTTPAPVASKLCPGLNAREHELLRGVNYQGIVCASLLLTRPLGGYYITNITDAGFPYTAVIEMTACIDPQELGGHYLVYLPRYLASDDPDFAIAEADWKKRFWDGLRRMYPDLRDEDVLSFKLSRERFVYALSTLGYSKRRPPISTSVPGVFLANTAHIINGTLNVNETLSLADEALPLMLGLGGIERSGSV